MSPEGALQGCLQCLQAAQGSPRGVGNSTQGWGEKKQVKGVGGETSSGGGQEASRAVVVSESESVCSSARLRAQKEGCTHSSWHPPHVWVHYLLPRFHCRLRIRPAISLF